MTHRFSVCAALAAVGVVGFGVPAALGQCGAQWSGTFGDPGAFPGGQAMTTWDPDGPGPQPATIVIGGDFVIAGGTVVFRIAKLVDAETSTWAPIGGGTTSSGALTALAAAPNGDLYAAGNFTNMGGNAALGLARWNGAAWAQVGGGLFGVRAMTVAPNGDLVVVGTFTSAEGVPGTQYVARWDGSAWHALGNGAGNWTYGVAALPNGDIIICGEFTSCSDVPASKIARWNGTEWSSVGGGCNSWCYSILPVPGGTGNDFIATGSFTSAGGASNTSAIARWGSAGWTSVGGGLDGAGISLCRMSGGDIIVSGSFEHGGLVAAHNIARWDGAAWSALGSGINFRAEGIAQLPGSAADIIVTGGFSTAGGVTANGIARWGVSQLAFTVQPHALAVCPGADVILTATAAGVEPLTYRWRRNTVPMDTTANPSAATTMLHLDDVTGAAAAHYDCVVTDAPACRTITSHDARLFVAPADVGVQGGQAGKDGIYDNNDFVVFINLFFGPADDADMGVQGGLLGSDGLFDNNDFVVFIDRFFAPCP